MPVSDTRPSVVITETEGAADGIFGRIGTLGFISGSGARYLYSRHWQMRNADISVSGTQKYEDYYHEQIATDYLLNISD